MQNYQLDFLTPGILPSLASSRKQIRHRSKSRIYPRLRPQRKQRFVFRVLNFGTFRERAMTDVFAIIIVRPARYISLISRFFLLNRPTAQKEKNGSKDITAPKSLLHILSDHRILSTKWSFQKDGRCDVRRPYCFPHCGCWKSSPCVTPFLAFKICPIPRTTFKVANLHLQQLDNKCATRSMCTDTFGFGEYICSR